MGYGPEGTEQAHNYPFTNIQEILHSLQGATLFSSLDTCGAYHKVRIELSNWEAEHAQPLSAHLQPFNISRYYLD